jgi:flotillin
MMEALITGAVVGVFILVLLAASLVVVRRMLVICPPNRVLVISGRSYALADGSTRGYRPVFGGRGFVIPVLEKVDVMSLEIIEIPINIRGAYSKGGIPLNVDAVANAKISSDPRAVGNAIERFLGRDLNEVARVARETLEGHLRGVLAGLTPEEVNEDRLKFIAQLETESESDLAKLGLHLDTLQIQNVSDEVNYLDSIGRGAIANVIKEAEMAESDARRDAAQAESESLARATVIQSNTEAAIAKLNNDLRRQLAELGATVRAEEERTTAAAREARALAERELQELRAELAALRLQADEVLPAQAREQERQLAARGDAARIRETGRAAAEAIDALNRAWRDAGDDALAISVIENLEPVLGQVTAAVRRVNVDTLQLVDGGDGRVLPAYVAAYPAMVSALFRAIAETTGIDIPGVVSGAVSGAGRGRARGAPTDGGPDDPPRRALGSPPTEDLALTGPSAPALDGGPAR